MLGGADKRSDLFLVHINPQGKKMGTEDISNRPFPIGARWRMTMGKQYYEDNGKRYPRCTSIVGQLDKSGPLTYWAAGCACDYIKQHLDASKLPVPHDAAIRYVPLLSIGPIIETARKEFRSVSQKALNIGSEVHTAIEHYLKTGEEPKDPPDQVLAGFLAFLEWKDEHLVEVLTTEETVYGDRWAGTLDLTAILKSPNNNMLLDYTIDFKTSKKPKPKNGYEEWVYQLAAYKSQTKTPGMGVLRLDKETGLPDWYDLTDEYECGIKVFNTLTDLWYLRNPNFKQEG